MTIVRTRSMSSVASRINLPGSNSSIIRTNTKDGPIFSITSSLSEIDTAERFNQIPENDYENRPTKSSSASRNFSGRSSKPSHQTKKHMRKT